MFLLWLWYMMPWIGAVVMARLCWRAQRRARARNLAKRVRGGMGVNSPSMKTHRPTQGLGWCIETRVWIPAFVLWTRR